jgi:hypothetical protein
MKKKIVLLIVALLVMMLVISGCQITYPKKAMVNGGGWIEDATFGFEVQIYDLVVVEDELVDFSVKGHLTYIDHSCGLKVIGKVTDVDMGIDGGFTGTFGDGETFLFRPVDNEGTGDPDEFYIELSTCYMKEGCLDGGNIQSILVYE